ncbi:MAG: class I SAM-dependent methyltransferase [Candidatus Izemoplasma sp.]
MVDKFNVEKFYDFFDNVASILYDDKELPYIEGMIFAFNRLLDIDNELVIKDDLITQIDKIINEVTKTEFNAEEIRKSVQLGLLKGFKHTRSKNSEMTPDTIGIFIAYLVEKLYKDQKLKNVFDPLIGTSNLISTLLNQLKQDIQVYGIDNDPLKCKLSKSILDLLDFDNEVFVQDTFTFNNGSFDLIVTDMPIDDVEKDGLYFPFGVINHHLDNLSPGGFFISVIENDFFERKGNDVFKKEIDDRADIFGLIKLSDTMFNTNPKSILILRKKGKDITKENKFLLVDLPSFNDIDDLNKTINNINEWFINREVDEL